MSQTFEFEVAMTCEGCSGQVKRILDRHQGKGVEKYDINLDARTVSVQTTLSQQEVNDILEKSGKDVKFIRVV